MKPTVGRIIHTRINGCTTPAIITACDPLSDDTRNGPVAVTDVTLFFPLGHIGSQQHVMLHDTEATAEDGDFFWPERAP